GVDRVLSLGSHLTGRSVLDSSVRPVCRPSPGRGSRVAERFRECRTSFRVTGRARGWVAGLGLVCVVWLLSRGTPASASMDIANNGPVLDAGRFAMRITNIGVIGNAFFNKGLSFDPSFEFPRGSGHECLEHAELWVGATR